MKPTTVELSSSTLKALEGIISILQPRIFVSVGKDFVMPLLAIFIGAWLAFYYQKKVQREAQRIRLKNHLTLILEDLKRAEEFLSTNIAQLRQQSPNAALILLPTTYFHELDYVGFLDLVSQDCVEHIRNISQYVFPRWNALAQQRLGVSSSQMIQVAEESARNCDTVINSIESELKRLAHP